MRAHEPQPAQSDKPSSERHALVIGGALAGLFAARVLVDHFDQMTILDRDRFPATPEHWPGPRSPITRTVC